MNRNTQVSGTRKKFAHDSGIPVTIGRETKGRSVPDRDSRQIGGERTGWSANERGLIKLVCSAICAEIKSRWTSVRLRPTPAHPRNITNGYRALPGTGNAAGDVARGRRSPLLSIVSAVPPDLYPCRPRVRDIY